MSIDLDHWLQAVYRDRRCSGPTTRRVATALAACFRDGDGSAQLSAEAVANASGIFALGSVRDALHTLRFAGWLDSTRVADSGRKGLLHTPTMAAERQAHA